MNVRIAKALFHTLRSTGSKEQYQALGAEATSIIDTYNDAVTYGFVEAPTLKYGSVSFTDSQISLGVQPTSGMATINDLYNIKGIFGADDLTVDAEGIELVFKK